MITDAFGLIYAAEENRDLMSLVRHRSVAALPLGGRYRAIDFVLSNMVSSGVRNVGVITRKNYKSLMDHLGSGKEWNLSRKNNGLFILPPFDTDAGNGGSDGGICDAVYAKLDYVRSAPQKYCLFSGSYTVYSADYERLFSEMAEKNADIVTFYSTEDCASCLGHFNDVRLYTDSDGRVRDMEFKSEISGSNKLGMDVYLMRSDLLSDLVRAAVARGKHNFVLDAVIPNLSSLRVYAVAHKGYVGRMCDLSSFYRINMDMLKEDVRRDLFYSGRQVYTKIKDSPPVKYLENARVSSSVAGDGCIIDGRVENSVLFRNVKIGKDAVIKNSIIMQDCEIGDGCILDNVIIDKNSVLRRGVRLAGAVDFPVVIGKGAVI